MIISDLIKTLKTFHGDARIVWVEHSCRSGAPNLDGLVDVDSISLLEISPSGNSIQLVIKSRPLKTQQRDSADMP